MGSEIIPMHLCLCRVTLFHMQAEWVDEHLIFLKVKKLSSLINKLSSLTFSFLYLCFKLLEEKSCGFMVYSISLLFTLILKDQHSQLWGEHVEPLTYVKSNVYVCVCMLSLSRVQSSSPASWRWHQVPLSWNFKAKYDGCYFLLHIHVTIQICKIAHVTVNLITLKGMY